MGEKSLLKITEINVEACELSMQFSINSKIHLRPIEIHNLRTALKKKKTYPFRGIKVFSVSLDNYKPTEEERIKLLDQLAIFWDMQ